MKIGTSRVEAFSDGVVAIAITIMVLEFKLPEFNEQDSSWRIMHYLSTNLPYFIAYTISFASIGIFWSNHHHMFHLLERIDENMIGQNLFFLFWTSLIPFATAIAGASPFVPESIATYGFVLLMVSVAFTIMRSYSIKHRLVHREEDKSLDQKISKVILKSRKKGFIAIIFYVLSIPLAFVHVYIAYVCLLVPPVVFFIPEGVDDEKLAEKIIEKNG